MEERLAVVSTIVNNNTARISIRKALTILAVVKIFTTVAKITDTILLQQLQQLQ
jgi:hypothetical protein